ncbi:MAG: hypothetical protein K2I63_04520 [Helicobacter sp.]|nr:hypothetical protein [Helicobacter sp.]
MRNIFFENQEDALKKLLNNLPLNFFNKEDCVVVGISFGGAYFAYKLAQIIQTPLTFLFTSPIYAPNNLECEIAVATETHDMVISDSLVESFEISLDYIYGEVQRQYEDKILPLVYQYRKGNPLIPLKNKHVLLVDEGVDTGMRAFASIQSMITLQAKTIYFVAPVASFDTAKVIEDTIDGVFCLYKTKQFVDIRYYYRDYKEISPAMIEEIFLKINNS